MNELRARGFPAFLLASALALLGAGGCSGAISAESDGGVGGGADSAVTCNAGLSNDPKNCGRCGHDCQGGACLAGVCQPLTLASGQNAPNSVLSDGTWVYWTTAYGGTVMKMPVGGGAAITLSSGQGNPGGSFRVDATNIYWSTWTAGTVAQTPLAGGSTTTLATGGSYLWGLAINSTYVFWTNDPYNSGTTSLLATPIGGGTTITLATAPNPNSGAAVEVDATNIYWEPSSADAVLKTPLAGGEVTTLVSGQPTNCLAIDATYAYFSGPSSISKVPLAGGSVTTFVSGQPAILNMAIDDTSVYWVAGSSSPAVAMAPLAGGSVTTLAAGQDPYHIAVDATSVYWTTWNGGTVMKVAKP